MKADEPDIPYKIAAQFCTSAGCEAIGHHGDCRLAHAIRAAFRAHASEALERAAKVAEAEANNPDGTTLAVKAANKIAAAIRELK